MAEVLFITEKASLGRALSEVLPGPKTKDKNHIRCGSSVVAWASGHLLELYEPADYSDSYRTWSLASLPIVPGQWKLKEIARTKILLTELKKHLKEAKKVVNAGDIDREGQMLIDEILEYCGWRGPTERLRINDINPDAIRKALANMKNNEDYRGQYLAGQARSRADWLVGMNLSRYCTLQYENAGYEGQFSVGRVQTPTLGLVVRRDREIAEFTPKPYFDLSATLFISAGNRKISGRWIPGEDLEPALDTFDSFDQEGRLTDRAACEALKEMLTDAVGTVISVDKKMCKTPPPLPYNLPQLQIDASKIYDITETLPLAQKLYEQGYITYPRSDCPYIPEGHHGDAPKILQAITAGCPKLYELIKNADSGRKSAAWDDSKVKEHHALLPTIKVPAGNALSENERKIYDLICARYVIQFLPDHEYRKTTIEFEAAGERFRVSGREVVIPGWKHGSEKSEEKEEETTGFEKDDSLLTLLPIVASGESGAVIPRVEEKMTTPPKRYTHDKLIGDMNSIHRYVNDPEARKRLKELDGIGTSATQEAVVGILYERGYIEKRKRQIYSTPAGQSLIKILEAGEAAILVKPELTAFWEQDMTKIENGTMTLDAFTAEVGAMVEKIVCEKSPLAVPEIPGVARRRKCLAADCGGYLRHIFSSFSSTKGKSPFFACSVCKSTFNDRGGEPVERKQMDGRQGMAEKIEADCPYSCGKKAIRLKGQYGFFWKCDCQKESIFKDVDGKPVLKEVKEVKEAKEKRLEEKCPVKGCKGTAQQFKTKDETRLFWKCATCLNMFGDAGGKPVVKSKR